MASVQKVSPCLWFDGKAEDAARFYCGVFPDSRVTDVSRYGEEGKEIHGQPPGSAMMVSFQLAGQPFSGLNGGPQFTFSEAISFMISCDSQAEIDRYWDALSAGGPPEAQMCGWLKDRFGVSWQVIPSVLGKLMSGPDPARAQRVMGALLKMKKLDIAALERAGDGA